MNRDELAKDRAVIEVDHEATLAAVRKEAEMWRTAKDRMAERAISAENDAEIWHKVARDEGFRLTAARDQIADMEAQRDQLAERVSEDDDIIAERSAEVVKLRGDLDEAATLLRSCQVDLRGGLYRGILHNRIEAFLSRLGESQQ
jgi:chromosome segregation ATPase